MFKSETSAKSATKAAGERTRGLILKTALDLFRRDGFEVTTMRDIAHAAKVATGAAYYYFPSKEAIVAAYYDQVQCLHGERVNEELKGKSGLRERLGVVMHSKLEILRDDRMFLGALFRYTGDPRPFAEFGISSFEFLNQGGAMSKTQAAATHWYPGTVAAKRPTAWWHWGRAVYVSRRDYWRITKKFLGIGIPVGAIGVLFHVPIGFKAALLLASIGLVLLAYSLFGLYRMYGHPGVHYIRRLVELGGVKGKVTVADLHIGTYRHAFLLSDVLPEASIRTVDCWNVEGESAEEAVQDVRDLELPPTGNPRIVASKADHFSLPLPDASCDAACFGFGTHAIPTGGAREKTFSGGTPRLKARGTGHLFDPARHPTNP